MLKEDVFGRNSARKFHPWHHNPFIYKFVHLRAQMNPGSKKRRAQIGGDIARGVIEETRRREARLARPAVSIYVLAPGTYTSILGDT